MGCDIHLFTERKRSIRDEEKWINMDYWQYNSYYDSEDPDGEREMDVKSFYIGRDYDMFSVLANVRNYNDNNFIMEDRGLPDDICPITKKEADVWKGDGHSHGYYTLKELMDYIKKNPAIKRSGMVSKESAEKLETTGETPNTWAQDVSPSLGWVYKEWEDPSPLKNIVDKLLVRRNEEFWIHRDNIEESEQDDKIRIVFWFDN
jgi:hypothetical protein